MKRIFTVLAMLSCMLMDLHAQNTPPVWSKNFGGQDWDRAQTVRMVGSDIAVSGSTYSQSNDFSGLGNGHTEMFLMKTGINGNILWTRLYGGSRAEYCHSMEPTADGGYILAGSVDSDDGDATNSGYHIHNGGPNDWVPDFWVVKVNASGDIEWQRAFGGTADDEAWKVIQTDDDGDGQKDDGYAIVGRTRSYDGDVTNNQGLQDIWMIKLTASGDLQWQRTLGGSRDEYARGLAQTPDGGYLVLGYTYSNDGDVIGFHDGANNGNIYCDVWFIKLNASGTQIEWSRTYGGDYQDTFFDLQMTDDDGDGQKDDGFIVTGETESVNGDVPLPTSGGYDIVTVKFDLSGTVQWHHRIGGSLGERGFSIVQTTDGGYAVLGSAESSDGGLAGYPSKGSGDFIFLKYTANGSLRLVEKFGGSSVDEAWSLQQTPGGCYIMAGVTMSNDLDIPGSYGWHDAWVLNWCAPVNSHLPVKLVDFKARYEVVDKVVLEWNTSSEQNNDRFEIQRSVDGITFRTIGTVKGAGTSNINIKYGYIDYGVDALGAEVVYYRLHQVDFDGKSSASPVVTVRPKPKKTGDIRIWPNPTDGIIHLQLKNAPSGPVRATVYNANGQVIMNSKLLKSTNEINLKGKNAGTYFIRLEDNNGLIQIQQVILK